MGRKPRTREAYEAEVRARLGKHYDKIGKYPVAAIARLAGVNGNQLRKWLHRLESWDAEPSAPRKVDPNRAEQNARRVLGDHVARLGVDLDKDIARDVGKSAVYVCVLRAALGIPKAPREHWGSQRFPPSTPEEDRIRERLGEHFCRLGIDLDTEIARATGYTKERIRQFRNVLGIPRPPNRTVGKIRALQSRGALGTTRSEVAKQVGISPWQVRRYLPEGTPFAHPEPFQGDDTPTTRVVLPLLATHTNDEIAAMAGITSSRVAQIRATVCVPSPTRGTSRRGNPPPTFETTIERASCALGRDVDTLDTANISALHRKHGVSIATLRRWRSALFNCGFFERSRKNACDSPA